MTRGVIVRLNPFKKFAAQWGEDKIEANPYTCAFTAKRKNMVMNLGSHAS